MSSERHKKKRFGISLIIFIFIYLILRSIPILYASTFKTTLADKSSVEEKIETEGIIIKKEQVYKADCEGKVSLNKKKGDRVGVGVKIGQLSSISDNSTLKTKLDEVNKKIESLENIENDSKLLEEDKEKNLKNIDVLVDELQTKIFEGKYETASLLENELYLYFEKQQILEGDNTLAAQSLKNLKEKRDRLLKEISDNAITYYSQESGIISYNVDGLEDVFSANDVLNYNYDNFRKIQSDVKKIKDGMNLEVGEPVFKIIDNLEWYLMVKVDDIRELDKIEEGSNILVSIDDKEEKIEGKIVKIDKNKRKAIMIIKFNDFFHKYYDKRYVNVDLIKNIPEGLRVPKKVICKQDGIDGVYVKDISGIIRFRPIKILGQDDKYAIVDEGDKNHMVNIEGSDKVKKTVTTYDEILLNTSRIREGQIVD